MGHQVFDELLDLTSQTGRVTFYSRTKKALWTKGETSGNYLEVDHICLDCDNDSILIKAKPLGPTCHTGEVSCFKAHSIPESEIHFLSHLASVIKQRKESGDEKSYTASLLKSGTSAVAQKVGEEAVETVIEAMSGNRELFLEEAADLLFHYLVLIEDQDLDLDDVLRVLKERHSA